MSQLKSSKISHDVIADMYEAIANMRKYLPLYNAVLEFTKDKEQAIEALKYIIKIEKEIDGE